MDTISAVQYRKGQVADATVDLYGLDGGHSPGLVGRAAESSPSVAGGSLWSHKPRFGHTGPETYAIAGPRTYGLGWRADLLSLKPGRFSGADSPLLGAGGSAYEHSSLVVLPASGQDTKSASGPVFLLILHWGDNHELSQTQIHQIDGARPGHRGFAGFGHQRSARLSGDDAAGGN